MANLFQVANEIVSLLARRNPEWPSTDPTGGNSGTSTLDASPFGAVGVPLSNAPAVLVQVLLREEDGKETQYITVDSSNDDDLDDTYEVTVDSNTVSYDASSENPADAVALVNGIVDAINADGTVGGIVGATAVDADEDGDVDTIRLVSTAGDESFTLSTSVTDTGAGTGGTLTSYGDATSLDIAVWLRSKSEQRWSKANGGDYTGIDRDGWVEEFRVGGFDYIYVQVTSKTPSTSTYAVKVGVPTLE